MKKRLLLFSLLIIALFGFDSQMNAQTTVQIGTGSSSSSTRGPFQRADTNSTTVFSRYNQVYTASELATAGITAGASISELQWELASSNVVIGTGDATLKVYIKNSTATVATSDTWANLITGSTLAVDNIYNTTNNFPGANGWMQFAFSAPFVYTGGALEIAVDWDCSQVSTPAFSGNGALKWRWEAVSSNLVVKKTSSSAPSTTITDLKSERANIQIVYSTVTCSPPTGLNASNIAATSADLSWTPAANAANYNWKIVPLGAASTAAAIDSGMTATTMASATGLSPLTTYDLYVSSDCGTAGASLYAGPYTFTTVGGTQTTITIGAGSSSSSTRGPFQRSDTNSTTVFSRFVHIYTASELAAAGITNGDMISSLNWELASSNVIIGSGDATMKVYVKNSTATVATAGSWATLIAGSSLLVDNAYNTTNNFPGANGWMPFNFTTPFTYTGGAIEIAVDWDCSQVSTPAFSGDGAIKWRWEATTTDLVVKKTSSSAASTNITDLKSDRANIQMVTTSSATCDMPMNLNASNITATSADLDWGMSSSATTYTWRIVAAGAAITSTAIDSGSVAGITVNSSNLTAATSYDFYVEADCGTIGTSGFAGPYNFSTLCAATPATMISTVITNVSCFGGADGSVDLTVTAGVAPYTFGWSNATTSEDVSGLMADTYTVTVTDGNGCPYIDSVTVTEPTALAVSVSSVADTNDLNIGTATATVSGGTAPYTYAWDAAAGSATTATATGIGFGSYSVTVTDNNGCVVTEAINVDSVLTDISTIEYLTALKIFPNPTAGRLIVDLELSKSANVHVAIYNITGQLVQDLGHQTTSRAQINTDLSNLSEGVYIVKLIIDNQTIAKRLVLTK
jgi:hypothetical protein